MEARELRYFIAVAEELHFGRAAERLGIAQPPLSRAIAQLERRLGVALLERDNRKVLLTPAGVVALDEGRAILTALNVLERRVRTASDGNQSLVLAAKAGTTDEMLHKLLELYARDLGAVPVELILCEAQELHQCVRDGTADVALLHLPFDAIIGLDTELLSTEGQVVILPTAHPLANRRDLRLADVTGLKELPLARWPRADGSYPPGPGVEVRNLTQLFQLIALGRATVVIPDTAAADLRSDLAAIPVLDAAMVTTVMAWPSHSRSKTVAHLVRTAQQL